MAYAATFWLARRIGADADLRRTVAVAVVMALVAWLLLIAGTWVVEKVVDVQTFGWPPQLDAHQPYVWGSVNTPPVLAMLVVPFVALLRPGRPRRVILGVLAVTALVVIPFSVGRAAWLGIVVALAAWEAMAGFPRVGRIWRAGTARIGRAGSIAVAAGIATLVGVLAVGAAGSIVAALGSRSRLWQQALGLFADSPLTGSGPGTFSWARLQHVPDFTDRVGAVAVHNLPLQTLAEGGALLSAAFLFVVLAWIGTVVARRGALESRHRMAVATLVGYAAFSLLDDFSFLPAVTVLVIVLAAWSLPERQAARAGSSTRWTAVAVMAVAAVVSAPAVVSLGVMRVGLADARAAAVDGEWLAARDGFRAATAAQPASALHWMSLGLAEHHLGDETAAVEAYRAAQRANPGDPRPYGALAILEPDDETRLLEAAARRSTDPQYAYRLGVSLAGSGEAEAAAGWFAIASVAEPTLLGAVPGSVADLVSAQIEEAISTVGSIAERDPNEVAWNSALRADISPTGAPRPWSVAHAVDAGDGAEAVTLLEAAIAEDPRGIRVWQAAEAVARLDCDRGLHEMAEGKLARLEAEPVGFDHAVRQRRAGVYREPDLGDYQPLDEPTLAAMAPWPLPFIEAPDCGW